MVVWPTEQIFEENYSEVVGSLATSDQKRVRESFNNLARSSHPTELLANTLSKIGNDISQHKHKKHAVDISSTCLPCLTHLSSFTLTCGHGFCRQCVQKFGQHLGGADFQLNHCILCGVANSMPICIKPTAAGLRILKLNGGIRDAAKIFQALKQLQQALDGPLGLHVDLVIANDDIGKSLVHTMFCTDGRTRDLLLSVSRLNKERREAWQPARDPKLQGRAELPNNRLTILAGWYVLHLHVNRRSWN